MKRLFIILLAFFSGIISYSQSYNQDVADIIDQVDLNSLIYELRNLSGEDPVVVNAVTTTIDHRVSNWGNDLALEYIGETLEGFGLVPTVQNYSTNGKNVFAVQEGAVYPNEYVMICAHYDSVDYFCADDNGSGTAGVIEAARILSALEFEYSIIYALWDEEELGLIGSDYYATQAASNGDIIHAVINMDMISWDGDNDMVVEIHSSTNSNSNMLANYIVAINTLYGIQLVTSIELPGTGASDHASFWNNGFASALLIEEYYGGDFNPYYHTENDRIAILDMPYFHEMAKLAIGTLASKAVPYIDSSSISEEMEQLTGISLSNYPNPFTQETKIQYTIESDSFIRISLLNSIGKDIKVLVEGVKQSGEYHFQLQAENLPSGMYYVHVQSPKGNFAKKLIVN